MSLSCFVGSFAQKTSTGSQAVTGTGFQPKIVIFSYNGQTADGGAGKAVFGLGASDGTHSASWCGCTSDNGGGNTTCGGVSSNTRCISIAAESGAAISLVSDANFTTMDSNGFTINWQTADATARIINYIALGGASLSNAEVGVFNAQVGTGVQTVSLAGAFTPNIVLLSSLQASNWGTSASTFDISPCLGVMTSSYQVATAYLDRTAFSPSAAAKNQYDTHVYMTMPASNGIGTLREYASYSSFASGTFAINWGVNDALGVGMMYIALNVTNAVAGSFTQPATATSVSVTSLGFQPSCVLNWTWWSEGSVSDSTGIQDGYFGFGASDGTHHFGLSRTSENGTTDNHSRSMDRTKFTTVAIVGHGSPTTGYIDGTVALDSGGFTVTYQHMGDSLQRMNPYIALGPAAGGGAVKVIPVIFPPAAAGQGVA